MKMLLRYIGRKKGYVLANLLLVLGWISVELGLPTLFSRMIDEGLTVNNPEAISGLGKTMLLICIGGLLWQVLITINTTRISTSTVHDIRRDVYAHTQSFSHAEYEKFGVSALINCVTNDGYQILIFLQQILRTGMQAPLMFVASMAMVIFRAPSLTVAIATALVLIAVGIVIIVKVSTPMSRRQQKGLDRINGHMREHLTGMRVIHAFNREDFEEERFADINDSYMKNARAIFRLMGATQPAFFLVFHTVVAIVLWLGSSQISEGMLQVGELAAFVEYVFHALFSFLLFATVFIMYPRAAVSANRIQAVLDTEPSIGENPQGITETRSSGRVEFRNVGFYYPGEENSPVLHNVSFTAKQGETVAFIGSTGSGKSTLVKLIPRLFDVTEGQILVDDVDVRDFNLKSLRQRIGFIPQTALLFSGTIAENLRFGKHDASDGEIEKAADIAQARQFIERKEGDYHAYLAEGGSNMSGGQKQRLSIARAVVRKPEIYVFDDSFSALDFKTDTKLRARLKEETGDATTLIVAQRIGTIMDADKIIVLDAGEVIAQGNHEELLENCELYYSIAASQLSEEELRRPGTDQQEER